jgi:hypothetical protein
VITKLKKATKPDKAVAFALKAENWNMGFDSMELTPQKFCAYSIDKDQ